jgi:hypothetical protein
MEVSVVVIPFPDKNKPHSKSGLVAFVTVDNQTAVSYCIIERAAAPSESGAISLEPSSGGREGESLWLWEPSHDEGKEPAGEDGPPGDLGTTGGSKARQYFKCVFRTTAAGCAFCVAKCMVSVMLYVECMKACCTTALGLALISCAVEMMLP